MRESAIAIPMLLCVALLEMRAVGAGTPTPWRAQWGVKTGELPAGESTSVAGTIPPGVVGTWLIVETYQLGAEQSYPNARVMRIDRAANVFAVHALVGALPVGIETAVRSAGRDLKPWQPTAADIEGVRTALKQVDPSREPPRALHRLLGADAFDASLRARREASDARVVIESVFQPATEPVHGVTYFITSINTRELTGRVAMAGVPTSRAGTPLPVALTGTCRLIRIPQAESTVPLPTETRTR